MIELRIDNTDKTIEFLEECTVEDILIITSLLDKFKDYRVIIRKEEEPSLGYPLYPSYPVYPTYPSYPSYPDFTRPDYPMYPVYCTYSSHFNANSTDDKD